MEGTEILTSGDTKRTDSYTGARELLAPGPRLSENVDFLT